MKSIPLSSFSADDMLNFFGSPDSEIKVLYFKDSSLSTSEFISYISRGMKSRSYSSTGLQERIFYELLYKDTAMYKYFFKTFKINRKLSIYSKYLFKHVFEDSSNISINFVISKMLKFPFKCERVYLEKNDTQLMFNIKHNLESTCDERLRRIIKTIIEVKEIK